MAKGKIFNEKRKHKRFSKETEVIYNIVPKSILQEIEKKKGKTKDIGFGGVRVEGDIVGKEGDIIKISIKNNFLDSLILFAQIKWIKRKTDKEGEFGLEFINLKDYEIDKIEKIIK